MVKHEQYFAGLWAAHAWLRDHGSPVVRMCAPLLARYIKSLGQS